MDKKTKYKIGSGFAPLSPCAERFVTNGYRDPIPLGDQIRLASQIDGLRGIGLDYPYQFGDSDIANIKALLDETGLKLTTLELGLYPDRKWKLGSITSPDPGIRRDAINMCKRGLEIAEEIGADDVLFWPGQDGFDYPFQVNYQQSWKLLVEGISEIASHRPDVKISIEYKAKEPRNNIYIRNAGVLLHLLNMVNMANVGATIDYGHSLIAGENPAEAAVLLAQAGKLFQVHVNDNYRDWDHDMLVGTVSLWETLEFFYWLLKINYEGWIIMDVFPYREDGMESFRQCVWHTEKCIDLAHKIINSDIEFSMRNADALSGLKTLWNSVLQQV